MKKIIMCEESRKWSIQKQFILMLTCSVVWFFVFSSQVSAGVVTVCQNLNGYAYYLPGLGTPEGGTCQ
jgi:hypothetical protein